MYFPLIQSISIQKNIPILLEALFTLQAKVVASPDAASKPFDFPNLNKIKNEKTYKTYKFKKASPCGRGLIIFNAAP